MDKTRSLAVSFGSLVVIIAGSPVLAITPGWLGPQLLTLIVAIMLLLLSAAPDADVHNGLAIVKPLTFAALLPAGWMLLQILPVPLGSVDHPVWRSAAAALGDALPGHISLDLGFTLRGLFGYFSLISLTFLTIILARDRERAETVLFALCTVTTFVAVELILFRNLRDFQSDHATNLVGSLVALTAFGVILNVAFMIRTVERRRTRGQRKPQPLRNYLGMLLLGVVGVGICMFAMISFTTYDNLISMAFGLAALGLVVLLRRLNLSRWTAATVGAAVMVACGGIIALRFAANPAVNPFFRFTAMDSADAGVASLRMISDSNWFGAGIGSYSSLAAIYRDASGFPGQTAINTITSMALEWGRGGLLIAIFLLLQLLVVLFRGALSRGRDSFYAAAAAACLITAFCEAYCDASFTNTTVQLTAAIIVGLGLSQTIGRRAH